MSQAITTVTRETIRTGRYAWIGTTPESAARVWIVLHGYGQLARRFLRPFAGVVPPDTCVVAPEGLSRFYREMPKADGSHLHTTGATWMTREQRDDDIRDALRWLSLVHAEVATGPSVRAVGVLAFSQGVATATRWLASGAVHPDALVIWAGELAQDIDQGALSASLSNADVTLVAGTQDQFVSATRREQALAAVRAWHPAAMARTFEGPHELDQSTVQALLESLMPRRAGGFVTSPAVGS
jgi:predicted esterase